jgi:hypothetical protein
MIKLLDLFDRFKYGVISVAITYMGIFMYMTMSTYTVYGNFGNRIDAISESKIEDKEEIELTPENIETAPLTSGESPKNVVNDVNDTRNRSTEDFSTNKASSSGENKALEDEARMKAEAKAEREKLGTNQAVKLTPRESEILKNQKVKSDQANAGGKNAFKGRALVDYSLPGRSSVSLPAPSYKCGIGQNGFVFITISVNASGQVVGTKYEPGKSSGASECEVQEGLAYAKRSRFSTGGAQTGYITYTFVSQ